MAERPTPAGTHLSDDLCHDIVLGLVAQSDARRAAQHAMQCAPCESLLLRAATELETLRSRGTPQRQSDGIFAHATPSAHDRRHDTAPRRRPVLTRRWFWALAAGLVLAVLLTWRTGLRHGESTAYWLPVETDGLQPRSESHGDTGFDTALQAYQQHDTQRALPLLQATLPDEGRDLLRRIYLASALVHTGSADQGLQVLQDLDVETLPQPWRDRCLWIQIDALEAVGRMQEAQVLMRQLADSPGEFRALARQRLGTP